MQNESDYFRKKFQRKDGNAGITLIALIITVIVLLILAGTAISIAINGGDIFSRASQARNSWNYAVESENAIVNSYIGYLNQYSGGITPEETISKETTGAGFVSPPHSSADATAIPTKLNLS